MTFIWTRLLQRIVYSDQLNIMNWLLFPLTLMKISIFILNVPNYFFNIDIHYLLQSLDFLITLGDIFFIRECVLRHWNLTPFKFELPLFCTHVPFWPLNITWLSWFPFSSEFCQQICIRLPLMFSWQPISFLVLLTPRLMYMLTLLLMMMIIVVG